MALRGISRPRHSEHHGLGARAVLGSSFVTEMVNRGSPTYAASPRLARLDLTALC
jgi:hypothetical protein